jgi:hypothetical protein
VTAWPVDEDDRDPILDACLAEVVGGVTPPDLSDRILSAWKARQAESGRCTEAVKGTSSPSRSAQIAENEGQATHGVDSGEPQDFSRRQLGSNDRSDSPVSSVASPLGLPSPCGTSKTKSSWDLPLRLASLAAMVVVGVGLGLAALHLFGPTRAPEFETADRGPAGSRTSDDRPPRPGDPGSFTPSIVGELLEDLAQEPAARDRELTQNSQNAGGVPGEFRPGVPDVVRLDQVTLVSHVNQTLEALWLGQGIRPSEEVADHEWLGRTFLYLLGREPTLREREEFEEDDSPEKRRRWVGRLHTEPNFAEQYAQHWAAFWATAWLGPAEAYLGSASASRVGFELYLRDAFLADQSMQEIVHELLTAEGSGQPMADDYHGAANFLIAYHRADGVPAAAAVSRRLLGQRLDCAQCHDHPFHAEWTQRKFWELNSFFRQLHVEDPAEGEMARLVDRDAAEEEVFYEEPSGYQRAAHPVLPDGVAVGSSRYVEQVKRRELLGSWIASSDQFARATVNRVWAHFFSYGLVHPVDDMGPHNPPIDSELLDTLTEQFVAHDYRLRQLTQWIVLSTAFGRSASPNELNVVDTPERGEAPLFSRFYFRPSSPAAAWDSLRELAEMRSDPEDFAERLRREGVGRLARLLSVESSPEADAGTSGDAKIDLLSALVGQSGSSRTEGLVFQKILQSDLTMDEKIDHLFWAAIGRAALPRELDLVRTMLKDPTEPATVLQDVWWTLLHSKEFLSHPEE